MNCLCNCRPAHLMRGAKFVCNIKIWGLCDAHGVQSASISSSQMHSMHKGEILPSFKPTNLLRIADLSSGVGVRNIKLNAELGRTLNSNAVEPSWFRRVFKIVNKLDYSKSKLIHGGYLLYEKCTDGLDYSQFVQYCGLPDTYYSWFLVTELHVWMCMVRCMDEDKEGRLVRNEIVKSLWHDANIRAKKLGGISTETKNEQMEELNQQFMASLFLYDEGLQSDDKILAGALWRRMLQRDCNDPEILETLVHYVRKQVLNLESFSREDVLINGHISWIPLQDVK